MGRQRQRMRPTRRQSPANQPAQQAAAPASAAPRTAARRPVQPAWRTTLDSFGGFWTVGVILVAVLVVGAMIYTSASGNTSSAVSKDPLMGEQITRGGAGNHVTQESQLVITPGDPPVGGPHFATPQAPGIYDSAIPDGAAIHSLEHGIIWLTYNPSKLDAAGIDKLKDVQRKYSRDVIVSPRPDNTMAVAAASWERLLRQDSVDTGELEKFIKTNRNRSPEPGVR